MGQTEQQFLNELEKKFRVSANKLLSLFDVSQYRNVALCLFFLKYGSGLFDFRGPADAEIRNLMDSVDPRSFFYVGIVVSILDSE